ncbi:hypothetical protein D3C75_1190810 [compost metagenome]
MVFPSDTTEEYADLWRTQLKGRIAMIDFSKGEQHVLDQAISHVGWLVDEVSKVSPSVSRVFDLGIALTNCSCFVAKGVVPGGEYNFELIESAI